MRVKALILRMLGYKTIEELSAEMDARGQARVFTSKDFDRHKRLTLALLPRGIHFPKTGEIWEALHDVKVGCRIYYAAPYTGWEEVVLPAGERIVAGKWIGEKDIRGTFCPARYKELEQILIPQETRASPKYDGYGLDIDTLELDRSFWLVGQTNITSPWEADKSESVEEADKRQSKNTSPPAGANQPQGE